MKQIVRLSIVGLLAGLFSTVFIQQIVLPTLWHYPRLTRVMARFPDTPLLLIIFLTLTLWLGWLQWDLRQPSVIYSYLVYSVYLLLLFIVLFTKAATYHAINLNPFDFLRLNKQSLIEASLNVIYFIPLGTLYAVKANLKQTIAIAGFTILGIEILQYAFYLGTFAVSDILLNGLGCLLGFYCASLLKNRFNIKSS